MVSTLVCNASWSVSAGVGSRSFLDVCDRASSDVLFLVGGDTPFPFAAHDVVPAARGRGCDAAHGHRVGGGDVGEGSWPGCFLRGAGCFAMAQFLNVVFS